MKGLWRYTKNTACHLGNYMNNIGRRCLDLRFSIRKFFLSYYRYLKFSLICTFLRVKRGSFAGAVFGARYSEKYLKKFEWLPCHPLFSIMSILIGAMIGHMLGLIGGLLISIAIGVYQLPVWFLSSFLNAMA